LAVTNLTLTPLTGTVTAPAGRLPRRETSPPPRTSLPAAPYNAQPTDWPTVKPSPKSYNT